MAPSVPPHYQQIADELRRNIELAVYQVGDQLPTEVELSKRFDVNRHTLRRAIEILRQEGLVRVDRGRGMFVAAAPISLTIGKRVRYNEMLKAQGLSPTKETLRIAKLPADDPVAKRLKLTVGDPVVVFERLCLADGYALSLASSYFPCALMLTLQPIAKPISPSLRCCANAAILTIFARALAFQPGWFNPETLTICRFHCSRQFC